MLQLALQNLDGTPLLPANFGSVLPGTTSPPMAFRVANVGSEPIAAPIAWIEQVSAADGEFKVTIGNVPVTGTTRQTATVLPALAVDAVLIGSAVWYNPANSTGLPVDTGRLFVAAF